MTDVLDKPSFPGEVDRSGMMDHILGFPEQVEEAIEIGRDAQLPPWKGLKGVAILGMGGSAIGGDLVRGNLSASFKPPIGVVRDYTLPFWVERDFLVIASSYSGNTEETLSSYQEALFRGTKIIIITTGGRLGELASKDGFPWIRIPSGFPPRAALAYSFFPILLCLQRFFGLGDLQLNGLADHLRSLREEYRPQIPTQGNLAKVVAGKIAGRLPIIYSAPGPFEAVGIRWRGQLAENAKTLSFTSLFPELNHNEIVGWELGGGVKEKAISIFLQDSGYHPRIIFRMELTAGMMEKDGVEVLRLESSGKSLLERVFSLIHLGDWVSWYLALLEGVDPTPVERIDWLKGELAKL